MIRTGQYFRLVNLDKEEFVDPWAIGGPAKLWEWCANNQCRVIPFLLRRSNERGGGDIRKSYRLAGRWASDKLLLVGDYDKSGLFQKAEKEFNEISDELIREFNHFIQEKRYMVGKP